MTDKILILLGGMSGISASEILAQRLAEREGDVLTHPVVENRRVQLNFQKVFIALAIATVKMARCRGHV